MYLSVQQCTTTATQETGRGIPGLWNERTTATATTVTTSHTDIHTVLLLVDPILVKAAAPRQHSQRLVF